MKNFLIIVLIILSCFYSCSGKSSESGDAVEKITDPKALGEEIGKHYDEMMDKLVSMLESADSINKLKEDVAELKDEYIGIFVEYGKMREELSEADKPKVDSALMSVFRTLDTERFDKYSELQQKYRAEDTELGSEISSFNILTQYAFFELLKKQAPEEAERLGIE
jgi:hypothetical protein